MDKRSRLPSFPLWAGLRFIWSAALLLLASQTELAKAAPARTAANAVPAGFEDFDSPQSAIVEVLFGGKAVGTARVTYSAGTFSFDQPDAVLALLGELTDSASALAELSRPNLPANAHLLCRPGADQTACERFDPSLSGFILDKDRFKVLIFLRSELLAVQTNVINAYLPPPDRGAGLLNSISAVVSGGGRQGLVANLENQLVIGDGERRMRAEFGYATGLGVRLDTLRVELDRPGWRYSAGALWSRSSGFSGRRQIIGIEAATQIDTRLDKDNLKGSALVVFLEQRSRVDIMRDGRVLASRIYDAGNQQLDTSALPDGVFEVTLRILGINGAQREERQFYSKNAVMPAPGQTIFHAAAGLLAAEQAHALPKPTGTPFAQVGYARRLSRHLSLDLLASVTDQTGMLELGATLQTPLVQLRGAALLSSRGDRGILAQVSSQGTSALNFNVDLRRITVAKTSIAPLVLSPPTTRIPSAWLAPAAQSFTQATGSISYSLPRAQLQANGYYRKERGQSADYSIGPSLRLGLLQRSAWQLTLQGDAALTSRGKSGYLGLNLQFLGARSSLTARAGGRMVADTAQPRRTAAVGVLSGALTRTTGAGELELAAGYERDLDRDLLNLTGQLRGNSGTVGAQFSKGVSGQATPLQYSLGLQTTLVARAGRVGLTGTRRGEGALLVKVESDSQDGRFEVLVNESVAGKFSAGKAVTLTLPSYRTYDVRIKPVGAQYLQVDSAVRSLSLFPGSVASLTWQARQQMPVFGRLVLPDGQPLRFAAIRTGAAATLTDEAGYFQLEASAGTGLDVQLPDARRCTALVPALPRGERYARLGSLVCRPAAAAPRLSSRTEPNVVTGLSR